MQVVAAGVHVLTPGQKVTVYQPKKAQPGAEQRRGPPQPPMPGPPRRWPRPCEAGMSKQPKKASTSRAGRWSIRR
jgi:hypothetical protein